MIVMVFEFTVPDNHMDEYQRESMEVRQHLADIEGFISVERFASTATPGNFVAIGYFEDEDAVTQWRSLPQHRRVQALGRTRLFSRYRLVMAETLRDYSHELREQAPGDSRAAHGS